MIKLARGWVTLGGIWGGVSWYLPDAAPFGLVTPRGGAAHMSQPRDPECPVPLKVLPQPLSCQAAEFLRGHHPFVLRIVCQS